MSQSPDTPTILSADAVAGAKGMESLVVAQSTPSGLGLHNPDAAIDAADVALARYIMDILVTEYHGYDWHVETDIRQGIASIRIIELMGASLKLVINLRQHPDVPRKLIVMTAGDLLERMRLPRGAVTKAQIIEARQNLHKFDFGDVGKRR